eukprot:SAG31_NODE_533_length_14371_cov_6.455367_10_plen_202_part_00
MQELAGNKHRQQDLEQQILRVMKKVELLHSYHCGDKLHWTPEEEEVASGLRTLSRHLQNPAHPLRAIDHLGPVNLCKHVGCTRAALLYLKLYLCQPVFGILDSVSDSRRMPVVLGRVLPLIPSSLSPRKTNGQSLRYAFLFQQAVFCVRESIVFPAYHIILRFLYTDSVGTEQRLRIPSEHPRGVLSSRTCESCRESNTEM